MGLKLSKTNDIGKINISKLLWGQPKIGKTSLIKTLPVEDKSRILYVPADPGDLILRDSPITKISAPNNKWTIESLKELYNYCLNNTSSYDWVVVDGLDDVGIAVLNERKAVNTNPLKAYDEMGVFMDQWIKAMRDIDNSNSLFITHQDSDKDASGTMSYFPAVPGRVLPKNISKYFDIIMCMRYVNDESGGSRMLQCTLDADPRYLVGDRSGVLNPLEPPDLGAIINKIKTTIPGSSIDKESGPNAVRSKIMNIMKSGNEFKEAKGFVKEYFMKIGKTPLTASPEELQAFDAFYKERTTV